MGPANGRKRRVSPVAPRPREGPLTEPTAAAQPRPQERVLMVESECDAELAPGLQGRGLIPPPLPRARADPGSCGHHSCRHEGRTVRCRRDGPKGRISSQPRGKPQCARRKVFSISTLSALSRLPHRALPKNHSARAEVRCEMSAFHPLAPFPTGIANGRNGGMKSGSRHQG